MHSPDFLFPRFLVFPPANPSNFSRCKCFSIRIIIDFTQQSTRDRLFYNVVTKIPWHAYSTLFIPYAKVDTDIA